MSCPEHRICTVQGMAGMLYLTQPAELEWLLRGWWLRCTGFSRVRPHRALLRDGEHAGVGRRQGSV